MKQKILEKTDVEKYFLSSAANKLDEDEQEDLVKVGLFYKAENEWKFAHQTYVEYGLKKILDKNFDDKKCAKFIVEVVLVVPSYRVIRTFMNFWILEKVNEKNCAVYQKFYWKVQSRAKKRPLRQFLKVKGRKFKVI
jgi:hypothetical protein